MHFVDAKGILTGGKGHYGMNIYRGCTHGCIYCDSRSSCYQFTHPFEYIEVIFEGTAPDGEVIVNVSDDVPVELNVVAENEVAVAMYLKAGFKVYGRNPRGFKSRLTGYQELVYMRMEL